MPRQANLEQESLSISLLYQLRGTRFSEHQSPESRTGVSEEIPPASYSSFASRQKDA